jgi:hypothetical protein
MAKYAVNLAQYEAAQAGLVGTKTRKGVSPKVPVPQNHVFDDIFGRNMTGKISSFHLQTSQSLRDVLYRSLKQVDSGGTSPIVVVRTSSSP